MPKTIQPIDFEELTKDFPGKTLSDCLETTARAVVDKMNEIVEGYNAESNT